MRTIKFRALDSNNKWFYWDLKTPDENFGSIKWETLGEFTGLKDKKGKEIYEGDICRNGDWEEDAQAYNFREEEVTYNEQEASFSGWNPIEDGMTCEVIGNIYENPELLKV
jgi:uncharacterized phage protein (TIGR01671 family)